MIRSARSADVSAVADLYHRIWHETHAPHMPDVERDARSEAFFLHRVARLMPNVVVAEIDRAIIGFAAWEGASLGQLFVQAAHRGSGLAEDLLDAAECGLREQNVSEAELHCLVGNARAKRFYERRGWRTETVMSAAIGNEERAFWVMRKSFAPTSS